MKDFYLKIKNALFGLILALLALLITYLIFGLIQKNNYLWGVVHAICTVGFVAVGWFTGGLVNRNIRRGENNKFADVSYKNPKKADYRNFIHTCYYAALFSVILNIVCYYAFDMGKTVLTLIF